MVGSSHSRSATSTPVPESMREKRAEDGNTMTQSPDPALLKRLEAGIDRAQDEQTTDKDVIIVDWDGPDDPGNPRNWSSGKKWAAIAVVSAYTFISPISSSMVAPAVQDIGQEFGITEPVILSMTVSIFVLAYAFGPLLLGPMSEIYGRARVLQLANLFYLIFNITCGFSKSTAQIIVFRLLSGFGGSAPLAVGGAVIGDCYAAEQRGQAVAIFSLAPLLGPALGPVTGAWIAQKTTWRWVFWSTSIVCGAVQILGLFYLRETFAPVLLERRAQEIRVSMGIDPNDKTRVRTSFDSADRQWQKILGKALTRPFIMFVSEPIIQLLGVYMAFVYGLIYLVLVTIPEIYGQIYKQPIGIAGLHYLALGIGFTGSSQINARTLDRIYKYYKSKNGGEGKPEFRLPSMFVGAFILPIGLFMHGWTAQNHVFWIVPDIALIFLGTGMILIFQSVQTYLIDTFTLYAASALAAATFLRSLAGFGFPLFAPAMYKALGYGKGDTILAVLAIVIGCPAPFLFYFYGERIRSHSKYAKK